MCTRGTVIAQKDVTLATRYRTNSLLLKYEKSKVEHKWDVLPERVCSRSSVIVHSSFATLGANEHDSKEVTHMIPAMAIKVTLHVVVFSRAWTMGLITIKLPPDPIRTSPVARARLLTKYLGIIVKTTKNKQQQPNPNARPYVKYISVKVGACDVASRDRDVIIPPLTATLRGLNRSQRYPTSGPNRLPDANAKEPTQAVGRDQLTLNIWPSFNKSWNISECFKTWQDMTARLLIYVWFWVQLNTVGFALWFGQGLIFASLSSLVFIAFRGLTSRTAASRIEPWFRPDDLNLAAERSKGQRMAKRRCFECLLRHAAMHFMLDSDFISKQIYLSWLFLPWTRPRVLGTEDRKNTNSQLQVSW